MSEDDDLGKTEADFDDLYARGTEVDVMCTAELEQARRVAVALEQQVALLTAHAQFVAALHEDEDSVFDGPWCNQCGRRWPCRERIETDRVLLAVSAVEPADPS